MASVSRVSLVTTSPPFSSTGGSVLPSAGVSPVSGVVSVPPSVGVSPVSGVVSVPPSAGVSPVSGVLPVFSPVVGVVGLSPAGVLPVPSPVTGVVVPSPAEGVVGIQVAETEGSVRIVVTDTGCGIAPDDLPRVKDKFFKANQNVRGSGIGLAIADEIVAKHSGTLEIESGIGVGTTVTITLPVASN